jgi:putative spermidine/putrescine transport system ATP-binding protein
MRAQRGHELRLEGVTQRFADFVAPKDIELEVAPGELVALLGPSGCGKSTLLRIISGFVRQSEGRVLFDGQSVDHLSPRRRGVGIVFQSYALFPHMTVAENVAYGLQARKWSRKETAVRVAEMLALVHMNEFAQRRPRELSGGQQQRVALARCLAIDPKVLLLDEPFGALDKNLRLDMQIEVKRLQRESGVTTILVTHDQEEALSMSDRIAVMSRGRIEQVSSPVDIYDHPKTLFVNEFVGTANILHGQFSRNGVAAHVKVADGIGFEVLPAPDLRDGAPVALSIRPERLRLVADGGISGTVKAVMPLGAQVVYEVELAPGVSLKVIQSREANAMICRGGEHVRLAPTSLEACHVFPLA